MTILSRIFSSPRMPSCLKKFWARLSSRSIKKKLSAKRTARQQAKTKAFLIYLKGKIDR